ncbi:uncharacterized protein LOC122379556 [Amphibalanus amphitrite]|uniref:uncharacterized protein LOC122379556 n=1 Tax=Amphibalanus amphitrite TaxID=1232801 RepID=UPI001C9088D4|nr:uncharacterized protein LOC122379556 [Amphibalanus amphitrite]
MEIPIAVSILICVLTSGAAGSGADSETSSVFVLEPQDAWVRPGGTVQLDCELTAASQGDICAWRIAGTQLGVDHFYNVAPPDKVRALFPEHERVCSILIEDADRRHDGLWTCWPLANTSHVSSRDARLIVADETTLAPTSSAGTTTEATSRPAPTTTPADTTTEPPRTSPEQTSTSPAPPTTTPRATTAPPTSPEDLSTTTPQPPILGLNF